MLQGVHFAIHVSYLRELRAESAGVDIATPSHIAPTPLSKCVEGGKVVQTSAVRRISACTEKWEDPREKVKAI